MSRRPTANTSATTAVARNGPGPTPRMHALSPPQSRRQSMYNSIGEGTTIQLHWLFRSNIPRRRGMPLPNDVRKRNFFGMGEIISVLANVGLASLPSPLALAPVCRIKGVRLSLLQARRDTPRGVGGEAS